MNNQQSAISNQQSSISPPTFPARPVNGGPLPLAQPKSGLWYYEPKYNGWRTLVHVPTGTMFNREGKRLSIASEFNIALHKLQEFDQPWMEWLDCEALERRHNIGKGTLIVLDTPLSKADHAHRYEYLSNLFEPMNCLGFQPCGLYEVRLTARVSADVGLKDKTCHTLPEYWTALQAENQRLGCEFYEGVVAKRADSLYPIQLRSASRECPYWVKHRWQW